MWYYCIRSIKMKQDKKQLILDSMEQLMANEPYGDISVDSIAKKAGIGKGSIYYYFSGKDEILYSVIERSYLRGIHDYFENINRNKDLSAVEKLKQLFHSMIKKDYDGSEKNLLITLHLNDDMYLHHKMRCVAIQEIAPLTAELIMQGIEEGSISTERPKESAEIIVAVLTFILDDSVFPPDSGDVVTRLKILADVFDTCLKTKPGTFAFLFRE